MLSRLLITGEISQDTPLCVLLEIADAHGINYNKEDLNDIHFSHNILSTIYETKIVDIEYPINKLDDWKYLARFINKSIPWSQNKLIAAYEYIQQFIDSDVDINQIPVDFKFGLQTQTELYSLNACVLYKICRHYNIYLTYQTTIEQLFQSIKLLRSNINILINKSRTFIEKYATHTDLVNFLIFMSNSDNNIFPIDKILSIEKHINDYSDQPNPITSYDILSKLHKQLNSVKKLQERASPSTVDGSVALAAINYSIDISKSQYPLEEYEALKSKNKITYQPIDPWLNHWYKETPFLFDLTITFNPLFPPNYYSKNQLLELVKKEGYTTKEISSNNQYELLQLAYTSKNFYLGIIPNLKDKETSINLDQLINVPYGQLFSYGQRDILLKPITLEELIDLFTANENFTSSFGSDQVFSNTSINKLKYLLQSPHGPNPSIKLDSETFKLRKKLLDIIIKIQLLSNDEPSNQLIITYKHADPTTKKLINKTFDELLNMSFFMRGMLKFGDKLPVEEAPVTFENEPTVALNVTKSISLYESYCRSLGKIGVMINSLPLLRYKDGEYQVSTSTNDGFTIGERINIVKKGKEHVSVYSCIRMSSNWLASSAHKYIQILGNPSPFDIFKLRYIS